MKRTFAAFGCALSIITVASSMPARGEVQVGINVGIPAPPAVIVSPPAFVVVPSTPAVRYAPDFSVDVFLYGGRYYAWNGGWFVAPGPGAAWTYIEPSHVPRPVLIVPGRYYKVPPGHLKKGHGGRGHGHGKHDDDD